MGLSCECGSDYDSFYAEWKESSCVISGAEECEHEFDLPAFSLCGSCRDIYWSLSELGFFLDSEYGFIKKAHREYVEVYSKKTGTA